MEQHNNTQNQHTTGVREAMRKLMEWTGTQNVKIIFDSDQDEFTRVMFHNKVSHMKNVAMIGVTEFGDVFGGFFTVFLTPHIDLPDPNHFIFSFQSHGRCETPQRWFVAPTLREPSVVRLEKDSEYGFVWIGFCQTGGFHLGNRKYKTYTRSLAETYKGIDNTTLSGMNHTSWSKGPYFHFDRVLAATFH